MNAPQMCAMSDNDDDRIKRARAPFEEAMRLHPLYKGKMQTLPKCPVRGFDDFAIWYSPGVAAPCQAIAKDPALVYEHTNKGNVIAIVSDGSRVLGLGNIGPEAALPVMEGKALLFKYLGGVDAVPICLGTQDPDEIIRAVRQLEPSFGGFNLEDIAQPKCFRILDTLRAEMGVPVWHDDQQGTATVLLAGLTNALAIVGKPMRDARIAMIGMGAANVAAYRLFVASGVNPAQVVACDRKGTLHRGRSDVEARQVELAQKWRVCTESNADRVVGGIPDALTGADVCIAFACEASILRPEWIRLMASGAIVFACGNPVPEVWPWDAKDAGARIVCTGRSDLPNQINNSLAFPGIFRGVLDVRARTITDEMALAAARELARCGAERGLREDALLPKMDDPEVAVREAVATGMMAQEQGVARVAKRPEDLERDARARILGAREATAVLMRSGLIASADRA